MEGLFDAQVNEILSKEKLEQKLNNQDKLIEDYMRQYYKISRKSNKDSKDRMMFYELETLIIQESMKYTTIEDDYLNIQEHIENVQKIKKHIQSLTYPIQELTPEVVNDIFFSFVIVDQETYIAFINVSGQEQTPEMKNAVANPPLHTGVYRTRDKYDAEIKWSITLV